MNKSSLVICLLLSSSKDRGFLASLFQSLFPDSLIQKQIPTKISHSKKVIIFIDSSVKKEKLHDLIRKSFSLFGFGFQHPFVKKNFSKDDTAEDFKKAIISEMNLDKKKAFPNIDELLPGYSQSWEEVKEIVLKSIKSSCNILIHGESGTGKELVARSIHLLSGLSKEFFIPVNCGAIPSELIESELFGHEKGSFTGAIDKRVGKFELCASGTLFLDEIGDMPFSMQVKLLRVLQEREFEKIGSNKKISFDAQLISATHQPLYSLIKEKKFREDLYYRLNVLPIYLPPLRERIDDLKNIFNFLCSHYSWNIDLSKKAFDYLETYHWPGNIREFYNFLARCHVFYSGITIGVREVKKIMFIDHKKVMSI